MKYPHQSNTFQNLGSTIGGGALIVAVASVASKILGFFRDRLLASEFGASRTLDIYYTAFKIPDFIFNILILGALSSSFIPVFLLYWNQNKDNKTEAWKLTNIVFHLLGFALIIFSVIAGVFAPRIVSALAPGFSYNEVQESVVMTRVMLIGVFFFGCSNIVSGVLNALRKFVVYSLAPIFYNIGIIFGIIFLYPMFGSKGLAIGVVIGAFLHFIVQMPSLFWLGYRYQCAIDMRHAGVQKIFKLMAPRTFGLGISQINQMITNSIASTFAAGSIAVYNLAFNIQSLPISIFSVSLAISAFPVFSEAFIQKKNDQFVRHFSLTLRRILYFIIPSSIFILLLRAQLVRLIYGAGAFDWSDTKYTAQVLGFFSLSLFAQSLIPLLARSFYALCDSKTPVVIALISMVINIIIALSLSPFMGVYALALAFSASNIVNMIILLVILRVRIGNLDDKKIIQSLVKISLIALVSGGFARIIMEVVSRIVDMHTFMGIFWETFFACFAGGSLYVGITYILKLEEVASLVYYVNKFTLPFKRRKNQSKSDM